MNIKQLPFKTGCYSIRNLDDIKTDLDIIFQQSQEIHLHTVEKGYLILSKNDFGKVKKRVNLGIFNKKTNFIVGEKKSIVVWDNEKSELSSPDISEIIKNKSRYFLIYDLNYITNFDNDEITVISKIENKEITLKLNKQFGYDIGQFLKKFDSKKTEIPEEFFILKAIIQLREGKLSINKQVLINSNFEFLLGILEGYLGEDHKFILNNNINIYNFTYILNILGAQYSIRGLDNKLKHIRFKLPLFLKVYSQLSNVFFRNYKYFFEELKLKLKKNIVSLVPNPKNLSFFEMVNSGLIEMIPAKDLVFLELEGNVHQMYDLTMPNANATNYCLAGMPLMKNSDGDVLGVIGVMTRDAADECIRKFSPELKENFLNLSTGDVSNWGVKLDSQLGLYAATK